MLITKAHIVMLTIIPLAPRTTCKVHERLKGWVEHGVGNRQIASAWVLVKGFKLRVLGVSGLGFREGTIIEKQNQMFTIDP